MHLKEPVIKMKSDEASAGVVCRAHSSFIFPVPLHSEPSDTAEMAIRMWTVYDPCNCSTVKKKKKQSAGWKKWKCKLSTSNLAALKPCFLTLSHTLWQSLTRVLRMLPHLFSFSSVICPHQCRKWVHRRWAQGEEEEGGSRGPAAEQTLRQIFYQRNCSRQCMTVNASCL